MNYQSVKLYTQPTILYNSGSLKSLNHSRIAMKRLSLTFFTLSALMLAACAGSGSKNVDACADKAANGFYCVKSGDTLYKIGQRFGISVAELKSMNNLRGDTIRLGQTLRVNRNAAGQVSTANKLQWPLSGSIITEYTAKTRGIDIAAPVGTPVKAAADGMVIYVGESVRGYGKLVLVKHSDTLLTAYAYNDTITVSDKARVKAGQTLATVGLNNKGESALHFEVRVNGKAVNPMQYLPAKK